MKRRTSSSYQRLARSSMSRVGQERSSAPTIIGSPCHIRSAFLYRLYAMPHLRASARILCHHGDASMWLPVGIMLKSMKAKSPDGRRICGTPGSPTEQLARWTTATSKLSSPKTSNTNRCISWTASTWCGALSVICSQNWIVNSGY